jgi:hypothetical protein
MDWDLFIKILSPTIAVFIGFIINKYFENKPKLITFISQTFAITMSPVNEGEDPFVVHTHSLVVRNVGRKPSNNVRICHLVLPNFQIFPHIRYEIVNLDNGVDPTP